MEPFNPFLKSDLRITEAGETEVGPTWNHCATFFPYFRLYYVKSGEAKIFMHDEALELRPGSIYFIPAYSITAAECKRAMAHCWVHFRLEMTTISYLTVFKPALSVKALPCDEELFRLIINFAESNGGIRAPNALACVSLAKFLFSRFLPDEKISSDANRFIPVLEYIDQNITNNITNADLSKIMRLNDTYFSNAFTKQFGISPKQYVVGKKIGAAA